MKQLYWSKFKSRNGFTIIELITTLSIIGIISTGLFMLLGDVKTLQVKNKELDELNMMVASYVEILRYEPEEAIRELNLSIEGVLEEKIKKDKSGDITNWTKKARYKTTIFLSKQLQAVPKKDAYYSINISMNGNNDKTGASNFSPSMQNQRYKNFELFPSVKNYVFWVNKSLTSSQDQAGNSGYLNHNYEVVMINELTASGFDAYLIKWGNTIRPYFRIGGDVARMTRYTSEQSLGSMKSHIFREVLNYGPWIVKHYPGTIPPTQYNVDNQLQAKANVRGAIPVRLTFEGPPTDGGKYNIAVVNETSQAFDFYLDGDETKPQVEITSESGAVNTTYLKPDRDDKKEYEFEIVVQRIESDGTLIEYKSGYYYAD